MRYGKELPLAEQQANLNLNSEFAWICAASLLGLDMLWPDTGYAVRLKSLLALLARVRALLNGV
jgi:hypothetical protein